MLTKYEHNGLVWIDLESPTRTEVQRVAAEFDIAPLIADELLLPSARARVELRPSYIYLILHFPALRHSHKTREQEVDFIIGQNFIITAHYDTIDPLHKFSKVFEANAILDKSSLGDHAGYIFYFLVRKLYKAVEHEIEYVKHDLQLIEDHIFSNRQVEMVEAISRSSRDLLNLRQTVEPHRDTLHSLESDTVAFFGEDYAQYVKALADDYYRVHNHIMRSVDTLHELRETNNSLLTTRQNETMKTFTIMAFFTFPLTLIATVLDMPSPYNPLSGVPYDFWLIIAILAGLALCMWAYFRRKSWL